VNQLYDIDFMYFKWGLYCFVNTRFRPVLFLNFQRHCYEMPRTSFFLFFSKFLSRESTTESRNLPVEIHIFCILSKNKNYLHMHDYGIKKKNIY